MKSFYPETSSCNICGRESNLVSKTLGICVDCIREKSSEEIKEVHHRIRKEFLLPPEPPKDPGGVSCNLCHNECMIADGGEGYCGVNKNSNGKLVRPLEEAFVCTYIDPLPTNCCADWFCPGSTERGSFNLAVFFYGCNFDCIFCQNSSHKETDSAPRLSQEELVQEVIENERISCICYFGGSPEPHFPFALKVTEKILESSKPRVCWEWNGCGNQKLVRKAAELSLNSGGIIKFDLKAWNENLSMALCGMGNKRAYENFRLIGEEFYPQRTEPMLTATTLLVPGYVDREEVEAIAKFISDIDPEIPYSLLVFHPSFYMGDMPVTPRKHVEECYQTAKKYLKRVNIGNKHLLL